jgi:hypothetical protein
MSTISRLSFHDERGTMKTEDMAMVDEPAYHFDPVDIDMIRLTARLSVGMRILRLLSARELTLGLIRGRLRQKYPDISQRELNLKLLEEIERGERAYTRPDVVF